MIRSENARPSGWVFVDMQGRDLGGYVSEAKQRIAADLELPPGYSLGWSGQYEYLERAVERLKVVVPLDARDHRAAAVPEFPQRAATCC